MQIITGQWVLFYTLVFLKLTEAYKMYDIPFTEYDLDITKDTQYRNLIDSTNHQGTQNKVWIPKIIKGREKFNNQNMKKIKNKCDRQFGNIFGTKKQCKDNVEGKINRYIKRSEKTRFLQPRYLKSYLMTNQRPKWYLHPISDYYGKRKADTKAPFVDLTRGTNEFADDYLDVGDLARYDSRNFSNDYADMNDFLRLSQPLNDNFNIINKPQHETKINFIRLKARKVNDNIRLVNGSMIDNKVRAFDSDSSESTDEKSSEEETKQMFIDPKRYHVVQNSLESEETDSSFETPTTRKPRHSKLNNYDKYTYMQGRNRYYLNLDDRRRRLQHFLPKMYHWDEDEIQNLGYYWFNGPRGKYPEPKRHDY